MGIGADGASWEQGSQTTGLATTPGPTGNSQTSATGGAQETQAAADSGGLSTGAAAGIGVGATVLAVGLIGLVAWVWRRKRKAQAVESAKAEAGSGSGADQYPIPATPGGAAVWDKNNNQEKTGVVTPVPYHEIGTNPARYELPNTMHGRVEAP